VYARGGWAPIPEFGSVLEALAQWLPEILTFHRCGRVTNGPRGDEQQARRSQAHRLRFVNAIISPQERCCGGHR
jgi:hypothetical protein